MKSSPLINLKDTLALQVVNTWLDYLLRQSNLPGVQICIRKEGHIIFSRAYGYANLKEKRKLTTKDLFHIASHSKTFTSCAILQLIEQGLLDFHNPITDYILELQSHKDKRFLDITIRDLLSNRSGIFRDGTESTFWDLSKPFPSKSDLIKEILLTDLIFTPNECTKYSNMGFALLGLIIESVLGVPYAQAMNSLILKKLKGAEIFSEYSEKIKNSFADGHAKPFFENKRWPLHHAPAGALAPATGFCANAEDTSLFFDALLLGEGFLGKEMRQELRSLSWLAKNEAHEKYGLGLMFSQVGDKELIGHKGGYPGFSTETKNWSGTNYVISFFLNTNESIPTHAISSIVRILDRINSTFTNTEIKEVKVSGPLVRLWGGVMFVLGEKKGLAIFLESWNCQGHIFTLTSQDGEVFFCDQQSGYLNIGEKIIFKRDKEGHILSAMWGSSVFSNEKVFLKKLNPLSYKNVL